MSAENVGRAKSTRWVKASTANYDGDDWIEEEYLEDEDTPQAPKLPQLSDEERKQYEEGSSGTGDSKLEQNGEAKHYTSDPHTGNDTADEQLEKNIERFQNIDLDDVPSIDNTQSHHQEAQVEKEDDGDRSNYDNSNNNNDNSISINNDNDHEDGTDNDDNDNYVPQISHFKSNIQQEPKTSDSEKGSETYGIQGLVISPDSKSTLPGHDAPVIERSTGALHPNTTHPNSTAGDVMKYDEDDDDNEDEYKPQLSHFVPSVRPQENSYPESDNHEVVQRDENEPEISSKISSLVDHHSSEEREETLAPSNDQTNIHTESAGYGDKSKKADKTLPALYIDPPKYSTQIQQPSPSPAISEADSLHIRETREPSSHRTMNAIGKENSTTSITGEDLKEHAYLGSLINTPDLDENHSQFETNENLEKKPAINPDASTDVGRGHSATDDEFSTARTRPRSEYYSSVTDYFNDYAEENSDQEDHRNKDISRQHSSGSLSTGSFSIKSESRYRYSRASDRNSSFNQSATDINSSKIIESAESDEHQKEGSLNPALSINLGHWKPDTDSYRDQFINGNFATPPLPQVDNYARNSAGEIVEDEGSFTGEQDYTGDVSSANVSEAQSSPTSISKHSNNNKSIDEARQSIVSTSDSESIVEPLKHTEDSYRTSSFTAFPHHIPLGTTETIDKPPGQFFHEHSETSSSEAGSKSEETKPKTFIRNPSIGTSKPVTYNMKQISTISNPQKRIEALRDARRQEVAYETQLTEWLAHTANTTGFIAYQSHVKNNHVAQAYADATNSAKKHTLTNNVNQFLHKRRVFQDTSSHAQSLAKGAKGIFSKGKNLIKTIEK